MTKQTIILLAFVPSLLFGQSKNVGLGLSLGNNGQLDKILNDFYFFAHETENLDDSHQDKTTNFKYSMSASFFFTDSIYARLKLGEAIRKDFYINDFPTQYSDFEIYQSETNISPSISFSKKINKLAIVTGIEIPMIFVHDFTMKTNYKQMPDSVTVTYDSHSTITMTGGFIWGFNNFIGVKYYFTKWLGIETEINYGLLFANIGEKVKTDSESAIPTPVTSTSEFAKSYKKTFFSAPEVSFGLFFRF